VPSLRDSLGLPHLPRHFHAGLSHIVPAALGPEQPKIISGLHQKWALTGFGHRSSILPSACSELGLGIPRDSPLGFPGSRHPS